MAEFTVIETQEQFDAAISARLNRENEKHQREITRLNDQITALNQEAEKFKSFESEKQELLGKISKYETDSAKTAIAEEYGLPKGFHERLKGTNEDEWRKDAQELQKLVGNNKIRVPLASTEPAAGKAQGAEISAGLQQMLNKLKGD